MSMTAIHSSESTPLSMLLPAWEDMVRDWGIQTEDFTADLMPSAPSPEPGRNDSFDWGIKTNTGMIAPRGDLFSKARFIDEARQKEKFWTTITLLGTWINPDQYAAAATGPGMTITLAEKMKDVMEAINRRIMIDRLEYLSGNSTVTGAFSTQGTGRLKTWDLTSDSDMGSGKGNGWDTTTSDPLYHLDLIIRYASAMRPVNTLIIGPDAFFYLNQNSTVENKIKYNFDLRGRMFDSNIRGLNVKVIENDTYKEDSENESTMNMPGKGSYDYDTWSTMKTKHMMRETFGATEYEYGLIVGDDIGKTWRPPVYSAETYPKNENLVTIEYDTKNPLLHYIYVMTRYGFAVKDFGSVHKIQKTAASMF